MQQTSTWDVRKEQREEVTTVPFSWNTPMLSLLQVSVVVQSTVTEYAHKVRTLNENIKVPICCKMRIFPSEEKTIQFAKMLEQSGCSLLAVHGRTKEMKGQNVGLADWNLIRKIK